MSPIYSENSECSKYQGVTSLAGQGGPGPHQAAHTPAYIEASLKHLFRSAQMKVVKTTQVLKVSLQ